MSSCQSLTSGTQWCYGTGPSAPALMSHRIFVPHKCVCSNTMTAGVHCTYLEQLLLQRQLLQWQCGHRSPLALRCMSPKSLPQLLCMPHSTDMLHSNSFSK